MRIRPSKWDCFLIVGRLSSSLGKTSACEFLFLIICDTDNSDFFFNLLLENCVTNQEWQYPRRKMHGFCAWSSLNKGWCCGQAFTPPPQKFGCSQDCEYRGGRQFLGATFADMEETDMEVGLSPPIIWQILFQFFFSPKPTCIKLIPQLKAAKRLTCWFFKI